MSTPKPRKKIKNVELWYHEGLGSLRIVSPDGSMEIFQGWSNKSKWVFLEGNHIDYGWGEYVRTAKFWTNNKKKIYTYLGELK